MYENENPAIKGKWISIAFIFFFPLSIIYMIIRIFKHRNLSHQKIGDLRVFTGPLFISFLLLYGLLSGQSPDDTGTQVFAFVLPAILFIVPAIFMFWLSGRKQKKLKERYSYYRNVIMVQGEASISVMAHSTGQRIAVVKNDLLRMIYLGILVHVSVDEYSDFVTFYNHSHSHNIKNDITINMRMTAAVAQIVEADEAQVQLYPKKVECSGCGSSSTLKPFESIACPYCGTSIVYPK